MNEFYLKYNIKEKFNIDASNSSINYLFKNYFKVKPFRLKKRFSNPNIKLFAPYFTIEKSEIIVLNKGTILFNIEEELFNARHNDLVIIYPDVVRSYCIYPDSKGKLDYYFLYMNF